MKILKLAHHRNGICGDPFDVGIIEEDNKTEGKKLVIQFDEKELTGNNCMTAVLDLELLGKEVIEFGVNSWRGDHYHYEFKNKAEKLFKENRHEK